MFQTHHCEFYCEGLCGDGHVRAPRQMLVGGGAVWITSWVISDCCHCRISALLFEFVCPLALAKCDLQLSAMDVSVRSTMKGAAKCDKHCELQISVNRQGLERILCFWDIPESTPASVSVLYNSSTGSHFGWRGAASTRVSRMRASTSFVWALSRHWKHKTVRCRNQLTDRFGV